MSLTTTKIVGEIGTKNFRNFNRRGDIRRLCVGDSAVCRKNVDDTRAQKSRRYRHAQRSPVVQKKKKPETENENRSARGHVASLISSVGGPPSTE